MKVALEEHAYFGASGLEPNVPNPFNSTTRIPYHLAIFGPVRQEIYNTLGKRMRTLVDEFQPAGFYQARWDAGDQGGQQYRRGSISPACTIRGVCRHADSYFSSSPLPAACGRVRHLVTTAHLSVSL